MVLEMSATVELEIAVSLKKAAFAVQQLAHRPAASVHHRWQWKQGVNFPVGFGERLLAPVGAGCSLRLSHRHASRWVGRRGRHGALVTAVHC